MSHSGEIPKITIHYFLTKSIWKKEEKKYHTPLIELLQKSLSHYNGK